MHVVRDTVAMLCGSKSGGVEIGELTSISSPGRLVGWAQKSQVRLHPLAPPLLGSNPRSPFGFAFSSVYPPLFGLSDFLNPCLGESLHLTKSSENGCPCSVIPASRPAGGRPGAYYTTAVSCVPVSRDRTFLAGTATANIWPDKVRPALGDIHETMQIRTGHQLCR